MVPHACLCPVCCSIAIECHAWLDPSRQLRCLTHFLASPCHVHSSAHVCSVNGKVPVSFNLQGPRCSSNGVCVCVCTKQVGFRSRGNARGLAIFYVSYMAWHVTGERSGIGTLSAHLVRESGLACLADSIIEISSRMGVLLPELERGSALAPFRPSFVVLRPSLTTSFPRWRRVPVASRPAPPLPRR